MKEEDEYEGYFADCYVFSTGRTVESVQTFLKKFLPHWNPDSDAFIGLGEDELEFASTLVALTYLEDNKDKEYQMLSGGSADPQLKGGEIFFTSDGCVVYGVYCETKYPNTEIEDRYLRLIMEFCKSELGYIAYEDNPPLNRVEFIAAVEKYRADLGLKSSSGNVGAP